VNLRQAKVSRSGGVAVVLGLLNRYDLGLDDSTTIRMCQTQNAIAAGKIFLDTCACRGVAFGSLGHDIVTIKGEATTAALRVPVAAKPKEGEANHDAQNRFINLPQKQRITSSTAVENIHSRCPAVPLVFDYGVGTCSEHWAGEHNRNGDRS
jgi:hypothetical protein